MHRKNTHHSTKVAAAVLLVTSAFAALVAQSVSATPDSIVPVCVLDECSVRFDYSGASQLWTPPSGASNLRFDLYGAQGGQGAASSSGGGIGGHISGSITTLPASLLVYVGGAGSRGAGSPGGFNGGGYAGTGHGDEGSGGGATDIRTTTSLNDRLAVAGGGGGTG